MRISETCLVAGSILLGLLLSEIGMRIADRPRGVMMGWAAQEQEAPKNELGFRGRPAQGTPDETVLLLGDSQVQSVTRPDDMPEVHFERKLRSETGRNIRVLSLGRGGWGNDQELFALERYLPIVTPKPRLVALWFTLRNDLWNNLFPTHFPTNGLPKPTFRLVNEKLQGPNAEWLKLHDRTGIYLLRVWNRIIGRSVYPTDGEWEATLPAPYRSAKSIAPGMQSLKTYMAAKRGIEEAKVPYWSGENFENEKNHYSVFLTPPSPRMLHAIALTRAILSRIAEVCRKNGVEFVVFYRRENTLFPEEATDFDANGSLVTLSSQTADQILERLFEGMPAEAVDGITPEMVIQGDDHLNGRGNAYLAERVSERILKRFPNLF